MRKILAGMNFTGVDKLFQQFEDSLGVILTFHHVNNVDEGKFAPNAHLAIRPSFLDAVITLLKQRDIDIITMDEARLRILDPVLDRRFAVLTFDDAYKDNLELAYPVLKKHDVPFMLYVATGLVEGTADLWWRGLEALVRQQDRLLVQLTSGPKELDCTTTDKKYKAFNQLQKYLIQDVPEEDVHRRLREICWLYNIDLDAIRDETVMSWDDIGLLAQDPQCTIGAHTISHPILSRMKASEARHEMKEGAAVLEAEVGIRPTHFAYPVGTPEAAAFREFEIARKLKFKTAVTTRPGLIFPEHKDYLTALPRVSVNGRFQRMRYFSPLMTGLPTMLANKFQRLNV